MVEVKKIRQANRFRSRGNWEAALEMYKNVLQNDINNPGGLAGLAAVAIAHENFDAARELYVQALKNAPQRAALWSQLASVLRELRDLEGAKRALQKSLAINPNFSPAYEELGLTALAQGDIEGAASNFEKSLKNDPLHDTSFVFLAAIKALQLTEGAVLAMREALQQPQLPPRRKSNVFFALARTYEQLGDIDLFFDHLISAHRLLVVKNPNWRETTENEFKTVSQTMTSSFLAERATKEQQSTPLFIVGMPGAGVELMGRLLASHPEVAQGPHVPLMHHILRQTVQARSRHNFYTGIEQMRSSDLEEVAKVYHSRVRSYGAGKKFFTDTAPETFKWVGLIYKFFPQAKVINIRRDPLDWAFSNHRNPPRKTQNYANDSDSLGFYASQYNLWMTFWQRMLPDFVCEVRYESLATANKTEISRVLNFCGLPWHEEVLNFHTQRREIVRPRFGQFHQPLNARSMGRLQTYGARLEPLRLALNVHGVK